MATQTTTSRHSQLTALLAFAAANGYKGDTDKLEKLNSQLASKGGNSETHAENKGYAEKIKAFMTPGETYTNEDIRKQVHGLPVGSRGVVEPSKVNAIMNVGKTEGMFNVQVLGKMRFYSLA